MTMPELEKVINAAVILKDGRKLLPCEKALAAAQDCGVDAGIVGKYCNEHQIKIVQCKLGCFK